MKPYDELIKLHSKALRLPTLAKYETIQRQAEEGGWGYERFLSVLLEREDENRRVNQQKRRINSAKFPLSKSIDNFDYKRLPNVEEALIWQLATGEFVNRHENIIMIGNPGTGKTHLSIALGTRLCHHGYSVRFYTAANLVTELLEAQEERRLSRLEAQIRKFNLLILDEFSYLTFSRSHAELLFHILSDRNERGSVILTTNLEFSKWGEILPDVSLASALIDRLTHQSYILDMNTDSYRLKQKIEKDSRVIQANTI